MAAVFPSSFQQQMAEVEEAARSEERPFLVQAAAMGRHDVLAHLLHTAGNGGDSVGQEERSTAFLAAAQGGHEQCLRVLLEGSPLPSSTAALLQAADRTHFEDTALMFASEGGHAGCVRLLLQHSPDAQVTHRSQDGWNALAATTLNGHAECMALLLQHSPEAQVAVVIDHDDTAAVKAAGFGDLSCLQLLLQHSPRQQRLDRALVYAACQWGDGGAAVDELLQPYQRCVELLLSKGAMLTAQASPEAFPHVRSVVQDLAARALVPDMANEAAVQAAQGAKRCQAASAGLSCVHPTVTPAEVAAVAKQLAVARV